MDMMTIRINELATEFLNADNTRRAEIALEVKTLKDMSAILMDDAIKGSYKRAQPKIKTTGRKHYSNDEVSQIAIGDTVTLDYREYKKDGAQVERQTVEFIYRGLVLGSANGRKTQSFGLESCEDCQDLERGKIYGFDLSKLVNFTVLGTK